MCLYCIVKVSVDACYNALQAQQDDCRRAFDHGISPLLSLITAQSALDSFFDRRTLGEPPCALSSSACGALFLIQFLYTMLNRSLRKQTAGGRDFSPASSACPAAAPACSRPSTSYALPTRGQAHCRSATLQTVPAADAAPAVSVPVFPAPKPGQFVNQNTTFQEEHRIRGYEVTPNQQASIVTIANLMQASGLPWALRLLSEQ